MVDPVGVVPLHHRVRVSSELDNSGELVIETLGKARYDDGSGGIDDRNQLPPTGPVDAQAACRRQTGHIRDGIVAKKRRHGGAENVLNLRAKNDDRSGRKHDRHKKRADGDAPLNGDPAQ